MSCALVLAASPPSAPPAAGRHEGWLQEAVRDVAPFLRSHKFNEVDRRFRSSGPRGFYSGFPDPPLRNWHWEVRRNCILGFEDCVRYLQKVALQAASLRREAAEDGASDEGCKAQLEKDLKRAGPFDGPLERFRWRTTASYFMCWFTILRRPALETLGQRCDNYASCLDPEDEEANKDFRAVQSDGQEVPFACAQYSFCPDPCCPGKHYDSEEQCHKDPEGPCGGPCAFRPEENADLEGLARNRWNVSCNCSDARPWRQSDPRPATNASLVLKEHGGYAWQPRFAACTDVDECSLGSHACDRQRQSCLNLAGGYACVCRPGFRADTMILDRGKLDLQCLRDKALQAAAGDMMAGARIGVPPADKGRRRLGSFFGKALHALGWSGGETSEASTGAAMPRNVGRWLTSTSSLISALVLSVSFLLVIP